MARWLECFGYPSITRRSFLSGTTMLGAAAVAGSLVPRNAFAAFADSFPVTETKSGPVRGMDVAGIKTFRGIRYGADTGGANRFMPPVKPEKWTEVFDAFAYGPAAPQSPGNPTDAYTQAVEWDSHVKTGISEDCLRLNVWTPALNDGGKRPVFFYIHGGGYTSGSGGLPFDGDPLSRLGNAVVITVNHRLGAFGFMNFAGIEGAAKFAKSSMAGMLDLVAALEWVRDNAASFGGDPGNVTIFGQSGGGGKVSMLMVMPSAKGLFHKAAVQSGSTITLGGGGGGGRGRRGGGGNQQNDPKERIARLLEEVGVAKDKPEDLQKVAWTKILDAQGSRGFGPLVDGTVVPRHPFEPDAPEVSAEVPLIVGYTLEDSGVRDRSEPLTEEGLKKWADDTHRENAEKLLAAYRKAYPQATPFQIQARMNTDSGTRRRAIQMAERKSAQGRGKVYLYEIAWPSPAFEGRFGAVHGVDLGLILANPRNPIAGNTPEARKLANAIGSAMVAFAKTGDPNCDKLPRWQPYDSTARATMVFDNECRAENDPTKELRELWAQG